MTRCNGFWDLGPWLLEVPRRMLAQPARSDEAGVVAVEHVRGGAPAGRQVIRRWLLPIAVAGAAVACVPPTPVVPPPTLPSGVGVEWLRDQGGSINQEGDSYIGDFARYRLLDGVTTGPALVGSSTVVPVTVAEAGFLGRDVARPDGTARQPWNGFAGEGIGLDAPAAEGEWVLEFVGGSCSLGFVDALGYISMVTPSPNGKLVAVRWNEDGPGHYVDIYSLVDGGSCPKLTRVPYGELRRAGTVHVWAPDSSAIVYRVTEGGLSRIERLAASSGAAPTTVVGPTSDGLLPMGWSVADRLLLLRGHALPDGATETQIVTQSVAGGAQRVIDTAVEPDYWWATYSACCNHFGYYVPGTTSIVYNDGSSTVTNSDGLTFPWYDVRLIADAAGAVPKSIHGTRLPLAWHQVPVFDAPVPDPYTLTDVPNLEVVDRFVH